MSQRRTFLNARTIAASSIGSLLAFICRCLTLWKQFLAESVRYTEHYYQPHFLSIKVITAEGIFTSLFLEATVFEVEAHVRNFRQS